MKAQIITIGDEILIGQIVDTNAAYISRALNSVGVVVTERLSIGDDRDRIIEALDTSLSQCDMVITTGGLGPTKDDITKKTLAEYFNSELVCDKEVYAHVQKMLEERGIEFNELNQGQALVPACCTVLPNMKGTAPGMWFERDGKVVVSLPGVPFEMEALMQEEVLPRLAEQGAVQISPACQQQAITTQVGLGGVTGGRTGPQLPEGLDVWRKMLGRTGNLNPRGLIHRQGGSFLPRRLYTSCMASWAVRAWTRAMMRSTAPSMPVVLELRVRSYRRISPQLWPV